ncbi:chemotaxis protein CheY [Desulfocarbo indianensis]|nr:chemotaxis protein CheY [Desulfocarbo indianensis]
MDKPKILVVDDEPQNLQLVRQVLGGDYQLSFATDGDKALEAAVKHKPDLILMDVMMPNVDGYQACRNLKADPNLAKIPVIFVTAMGDVSDEAEGFDAGAVDYITKPIKAPVVKRRVATHLSLVNVEELKRTRLIIIQRLGRAAEFKDNETGLHVIRMSHYCKILAEKISQPPEWCTLVFQATPMHDVGKIGVPDKVLLKPGPLNDDEWKIMKRHPKMGADIIGGHDSKLLTMAASIALTHHEKWDGSGYPAGLKGEEIPLASRITAVADVFDALTTVRPYKDAWPVEKAIKLLQEEQGKHFDPELSPAFISCLDDVLAIKERWAETK